jgi:hypothetical protein
MNDIPEEYYGWWRILETGTWMNEYLDDLGPALIQEGHGRAHFIESVFQRFESH